MIEGNEYWAPLIERETPEIDATTEPEVFLIRNVPEPLTEFEFMLIEAVKSKVTAPELRPKVPLIAPENGPAETDEE